MGREKITTEFEDALETVENELVALDTEPDHSALLAQVYDLPAERIAEMASQYLPLKIAGAVDKQGRGVVHDALMVVKSTIVNVEKVRLKTNEKAQGWIKKNNTEAKRLTALMAPIRDHLQAQRDAHDAEVEAIRAARQREVDARNQGRMDALIAVGAVVELAAVVQMSDETFNSYLALATKAHQERQEAEAEAKAAADAKAQAEAAAAAAQAKAEAERIQAERAAIAAAKAENDRMAAELRAKVEAFEAAQAKAEAATKAAEVAAKNRLEDPALAERAAQDAAEYAEAEKAKAAAIDAAKPDAGKLKNLAGALRMINFPSLTTEAGRRIGLDAKDSLGRLATWITIKSDDLTK